MYRYIYLCIDIYISNKVISILSFYTCTLTFIKVVTINLKNVMVLNDKMYIFPSIDDNILMSLKLKYFTLSLLSSRLHLFSAKNYSGSVIKHTPQTILIGGLIHIFSK